MFDRLGEWNTKIEKHLAAASPEKKDAAALYW
jgi:hypothetical protein